MTTHADLIRRLLTVDPDSLRDPTPLLREAATALAEAGEDRVDAERYRHIQLHTRGYYDIDAIQAFALPYVTPVTDIMKGGIAGHLDAAIDAARGRG